MIQFTDLDMNFVVLVIDIYAEWWLCYNAVICTSSSKNHKQSMMFNTSKGQACNVPEIAADLWSSDCLSCNTLR